MISLCGRSYALPRQKTVVFCVDGCAPEYLDRALDEGLMPRLRRALAEGGLYARGLGQMPSFTNPNNVSIVTGVTPAVHGISGNYYFDRATGTEVPMNDPRFLCVPTIFEELERASVRTLCITAKDKLRALLGATKQGGPAPISLSAERAHEQTIPYDGGSTPKPPQAGVLSIPEVVGRKNPSIYDWDISHYAMEMGLALHARVGAELLYVSLTDYVQHKEAPGGEMANRFYARFDELLGAYLDAGFLCAFTADHGMNDKTLPDGSPNVRFLDDALSAAKIGAFRVILPITDPYVVHHGALGSYATVYFEPEDTARVVSALSALPGVEAVLLREEAAARFSLPKDRIGDAVVLADQTTVLGKSAAYHDLSAVKRGLRSHGGLHEQAVPIVVLAPRKAEARTLSNADIFDLVLNASA
jgi:phosphonoacetate hydrolase